MTGIAFLDGNNVVTGASGDPNAGTVTSAPVANIIIGAVANGVTISNTNITIANSSANIVIKTPTASQISGGGYYLNANGLWAIPAGGSAVVNTASQYTWTNTQTFSNTITFSGNVVISNTITANGSVGSAGQVLTSSASGNIYWSTIGSGGVNTAAQYTWTNSQSFSNTITVTGNATFSNTIAVTGNAVFSNTIAVTGNATFSNTMSVTGAFYSPGAVIQMQSFSYTSQFTTTTHGGLGTGPASAGTDTPLTVSITPKFSTSKIVVMATGSAGFYNGGQVWLGSLKRSGCSVSTAYSPASAGASLSGWSQSIYIAAAMMTIFDLMWVDSPATTTSVSYTLRITGNNNSATAVGIGQGDIAGYSSWGGICQIIVMEIAQ